MKNYKMIRGTVATNRCTNKSSWGSPLYCDCGCQTPRDTDPEIDLTGVTVSRKSDNGYANFILTCDGKECGSINTQHNAVCLDGHEFLGVDAEYIQELLNTARNIPVTTNTKTSDAGCTLEETAAFEKMAEEVALAEHDERNAKNPGYCTKCHSYCYGDCEAN